MFSRCKARYYVRYQEVIENLDEPKQGFLIRSQSISESDWVFPPKALVESNAMTYPQFVSKTSKSLVIFLSLVLVSASFPEGGRTPLRVKNGIVSSASRLASEAGVGVLKQGGNAVDAAIATAFALAVTWPSAGNIGGGGFLVYHADDGHATSFDFREKAPLAATERMYLGLNGNVVDNSNHIGALAVGVPGTVAGLWKAHQQLGSLPWADLVAPAVKLARDGIPVSYSLYTDFARSKSRFDQYPSSAAKFYKADGSLYELGETWQQPDLAHTLELIQNQGKRWLLQR